VPEKPDEKSKNPDDQRRYNEKKKPPEPTMRLSSSALSHFDIWFKVQGSMFNVSDSDSPI
jgi:hypothetical protein